MVNCNMWDNIEANTCFSWPSIARTLSSLRISMDPRDTKYRASRMSPRCTSVSPGGTWVVLNFIDSARRQPGLAPVRHQRFVSTIKYTIGINLLFSYFFHLKLLTWCGRWEVKNSSLLASNQSELLNWKNYIIIKRFISSYCRSKMYVLRLFMYVHSAHNLYCSWIVTSL